MVGRTSLAAVAASALLLSGGGLAYADNEFPDADSSLIEVVVKSESDINELVTDGFDLAEYKRVEGEGRIVVAIDAVPSEIGELKKRGFAIGRTVESPEHRAAVAAERDGQREIDALARDYARNGAPRSKSAVAQPGETVIQRANKFTNYAGTFLYVEAHNKATRRNTGSNTQFSGPTLALSYAGADGVYGAATDMGRFIDTDPTPDEYMYHRQLIRLTGAAANVPAAQMTVRVAASTGAVDTSKVTEWLGTKLPPNVANYQQGFFSRYQDPTENRAQLDKLATDFPNLVTAVNLPNLTGGYQRKSQAILSGTSGIGVAPPAVYGAPITESTGEITAAAPVASIPFNGTAGQRIYATVDGVPGGSTDFIFTLKSPTGAVIGGPIDTGTSPEFITNLNLPTTGTYTFEVSGYEGDLGDFTFKVQPVQVSSAEAAGGSVVLTAKDFGHLGGDQVTAEVKNPGVANSPLSIAVTGKDLVVNLATNAAGAATSTAKQVVDAINADAGATALVSATTYRNNAGAAVVQPRAKVNLDDFLNAPAHVARGPFQQRVYRIGSVRDGSKVGVFLYCQQHAREWTTGLTCVETAERLVRNYATDPQTKKLMDNVEVFVVANVNPDGGHYSMYDFASQRRNLTNYCPATGNNDPAARNTWGVDLNRNNGEFSPFDGYFGASTSCTSDTYAGPGEYSEPEIKNEKWIADTFPNIKFANNIHSFGGYFMWAPGAYKNDGARTTAPAPNIGIEKYFFEAGEKILTRIKEHRNTVILPERTGPIADVLYSAAGNSADDQWYRKGIISYSFETGADRFISTETGTQQISTGFQPCFAGPGTYGGSNTQFGYPICDTQPVLLNEGRDQAMEFASGNFGMVESAYDYAMDMTPPKTSIEVSATETGGNAVDFRFNWDDEAAVIYYTTDGSEPTLSSTKYNNQRARSIGEVLQISKLGATEIKWMAVDIKGNRSAVQTQRVLVGANEETGTVGGSVPATLALTLGSPAAFEPFVPGVDRTYTASTTANVISTAGDATLTVSDSGPNPGRLVNGAFALAQPLQGLGVVKTWTAPTSNESVAVQFRQTIGRTDPLRTGTYSKSLTFTLSTTQP